MARLLRVTLPPTVLADVLSGGVPLLTGDSIAIESDWDSSEGGREVLKLRDEGCALLVVSEELDELFEISDRLIVIAQGRMSPSVPIADATIEKIGEWMSGLWTAAEASNV